MNREKQSLFTQQTIMQRLSHYFLTPNPKKMPFYEIFSLQNLSSTQDKYKQNSINCFLYLYQFIRSQYNSRIPQQMFHIILVSQTDQHNNSEICLQILSEKYKQNRKLLIGRYIGLTSTLGEYLNMKKINNRKIQQKMINNILNVLLKLGNIDNEDIEFIVNKMIAIGAVQFLIKNKKFRQQILTKIYSQIMHKNKILLSLIEHRLFKQFGELIILDTTKQKQINRLFNGDSMKGSLAQNIHQQLQKLNINKKFNIFNNLLVWWMEGNDQYLLTNQIFFRVNLLVLMINKMDKQSLMRYSRQISMGIQRRLQNLGSSTPHKNQVIELVWGTLARGMQLQKDLNLNQSKLLIQKEQRQQKQQQQSLQQQYIQMDRKDSQKQQQTINEEQLKTDTQILTLKPPRNLYDCILGLRNPSRLKVTLKYLPIIIRKNPQDLIFNWNQIVRQILYNINQDTQPALRALFITRPSNFIDSISKVFYTKQTSLNDKIIFIKCLTNGIQQLSQKPVTVDNQEQSNQFYFKKVTSRYYNQKPQIQKKTNTKSRRWGHTRIAYQKKLQSNSGSVSLQIVDNDPYINRLYEIVNHLYFNLISKLTYISGFPQEKTITRPILKLLGVLSVHLQNHLQKYKILAQITNICVNVVDFLESGKQKQNFIKEQKQSCMGVIEVLNKISITIDTNVPIIVLKGLQHCILKLKKMPQYGILPLIQIIEGNIYTNYLGQHSKF